MNLGDGSGWTSFLQTDKKERDYFIHFFHHIILSWSYYYIKYLFELFSRKWMWLQRQQMFLLFEDMDLLTWRRVLTCSLGSSINPIDLEVESTWRETQTDTHLISWQTAELGIISGWTTGVWPVHGDRDSPLIIIPGWCQIGSAQVCCINPPRRLNTQTTCYYKNSNKTYANAFHVFIHYVVSVGSPVWVQLLGFVSSQSASVGAAPEPLAQIQNPGSPKRQTDREVNWPKPGEGFTCLR